MGTLLFSPTQSVGVTDVTLDDRGRLTLPKELREKYGDRYRVVELHDGVKLVPVSEDPLASLREEFADVDASAEELRAAARESATEDAGR